MAVGGRGCSTIAVLGADQVVIGEHVVQSRLYELPWQGQAEGKPMTALTGGLARDRQPAYSPDGDRVIFSSNRSGNLDLWAVDRRSGALHQLTDDPANDLDPAFTPDGKRVLWTSDRGGNPEIWLAAADGSGARQVTRDGLDAENPTMTADGEWIVYASTNNDKLGVWKIRPDGSDATHLAQGSFPLPEVSPDGRLAVCPGNRGTGVVIQVVDISTGDLVPFAIELFPEDTHSNVLFGRARWTPDGNAIAFIAQDEEGRFGVFVQDFVPGRDTTPSRRPVAGFADELATESLGISPDGTTLVVSAAVDRWSLSLADNVPLDW
jgi:TolB protein